MIVLTGGTGFLGRPLAAALAAQEKRVTVLGRKPDSDVRSAFISYSQWQPEDAGGLTRLIDGAAAVVNLAGESIASGRWTADRKRRIVDSRLQSTRALVEAVQHAANPPAVLINASATGYYGDRGAEVLTEAAGAGTDFLATLCVHWEQEAMRAASARTRVALIRTGIVLDKNGGALAKMLPPFRMFVGGPLGTGNQYMSWIHLTDWVKLVGWILNQDGASGPFNATAPEPVTNREFSAVLGKTLHRPSLLPAPAAALRLLLGEMAGPLLLASQRVVPARATKSGFQFSFPKLDQALQSLFLTAT